MKIKIAIIGTGYVGLTTGACFAYLGHKVICVDKDKKKIVKLRKGKVPIYEPGLNEILKKHKKNIEFSVNIGNAVKKSDVIFICVGTPPEKDGSINLDQFKESVRDVAQSLDCYKVIVNKSTVPVGTGAWTKKEIIKYYSGKFSIVSNPEFLRESSAVKDFLEPDRIVIGLEEERSKEIMLDIYSSINAPKIITDIKSAELIKYTANAFLATKISFINEIANICEKVGGDVKKVAEGVGLDKRIGPKFLNAGIGYGGSCFPKDIDGLIKMADRKKYSFKLLKAVSAVNIIQQRNFLKKIKNILKKIDGNTVCVWGLAFKPNTDDIRKSSAVEITKQLQKLNFKIQAYDPVAMENAKKELLKKNIRFCKNPYEAARNADVLALLTDWPEFSEINMKKIIEIMHYPYFLDGRNQFDPSELKSIGFYYEGIGRK
jgi:UDPglucose 6-dehydrogenase